MVKGNLDAFVVNERFGIGCGLWSVAFLAAGIVIGREVIARRGFSLGAVQGEDAKVLLFPLIGVMLLGWEFVRRYRRATVRVQGEEVEVLRRGDLVASARRADIVPWSRLKQRSDIVRGGIFIFLVLLVGGLMVAVDQATLYVGISLLALGLGTLASLSYMLFGHWTVEVPNATRRMPLWLTLRRADVRRLLGGQHAVMPWGGR